jgi:cell division protein FtsQ
MKANRYKLKNIKKRISFFKVVKNVGFFIFIFSVAIIVYGYVDAISIKSLMPIKNVSLTGNKHLTDEEIKTLAGIHINEDLFTVSNKKICERLLKSPWIKSVNVRKEFPETLSLSIEEAVPFALLDMNSRLFLVDEKGELLEELKDDSIPFLPVITGDPFKEREGFLEALKLVKIMNNNDFASERDHIEIIIKKPHELTATIDGNIVKMGSGEYEEKLVRFIELESYIKKMGVHVDYIDLRFANKAILKPINGKVIE